MDRDRYGRTVGEVLLPDGRSLNHELVRAGLAWMYRRYTNELLHGWNAACKRVGLEGKWFHDLRRTGVRNLTRAGVLETVAMRISGHKRRAIFDRYNITSEEDLREAAKRLGDYFRQKKVTIPVTLAEFSVSPNLGDVPEHVEKLAEGVGFEPTVPLPGLRFSRPARSATLAPLRLALSRT